MTGAGDDSTYWEGSIRDGDDRMIDDNETGMKDGTNQLVEDANENGGGSMTKNVAAVTRMTHWSQSPRQTTTTLGRPTASTTAQRCHLSTSTLPAAVPVSR